MLDFIMDTWLVQRYIVSQVHLKTA